ncbi:hypothetical protein [Couchioplanes caeruleus]|uniref:Uncharacterized protein n=2 Tax=Couchioplanes caeruleus TaxID=56438 RepID=A0A1K0GUT9_9ACTN|nr:hypothetical protein [Couchioplanes caeruleus]OJF13147.1 hypothetical protein BG844_16795 [Couchioplanes caeruleus subsp. caeruleus]ROP28104.1 hypothetical protein EDD30_0813 [Couchioplanes caeruleus]
MTTQPPPPGTTAEPGPTAPATAPEPAGQVYLVAGGDLVALFDTREAADIMLVTMIGANLDPVTACLSAARWDEVRADLLARVPALTITDARTGRAGGAR